MDFIDDAIDLFLEGWDALVDSLSYVFTGELFADVPDFFSSMFEGISEFSFFGLLFGLIGLGTVYGLREYMLIPFLKFYSPAGQLFWGAATYLGTFLAGYLLGKYFENTS